MEASSVHCTLLETPGIGYQYWVLPVSSTWGSTWVTTGNVGILEWNFEVTLPPGTQPHGLVTGNTDAEISIMSSKFFFYGLVEVHDFCPPTLISLSPDAQLRPWVYLQNTLFHSLQHSQLRTIQTLALLLCGAQIPLWTFSFLYLQFVVTRQWNSCPTLNTPLRFICPQTPTLFYNAVIHKPPPWTQFSQVFHHSAWSTNFLLAYNGGFSFLSVVSLSSLGKAVTIHSSTHPHQDYSGNG